MPGSTNFLQWNPNAINQESDAVYNGDSLRAGGAPVNAIFPSPTANKLWYQSSTFITALAQALVNKGYSPNDGSANPAAAVSNLAGVLANIMTQADMAPFALVSQLASYALLSSFGNLLAATGFQKLPGGLIVQWITGTVMTGGDDERQTMNFNITFPTSAFFAICSLIEIDGAASDAFASIVNGTLTATQVQIQLQNNGITGRVQPCVLALGH